MDNITNLTYTAVNRYMTTLGYFGYLSYDNVDKLLVLIMIEDILNGEFSYFITEEDYNIITSALHCLMGSTCLIDFPVYQTYDKLFHEIQGEFRPRITEDGIIRKTQIDNFRIEA